MVWWVLKGVKGKLLMVTDEWTEWCIEISGVKWDCLRSVEVAGNRDAAARDMARDISTS